MSPPQAAKSPFSVHPSVAYARSVVERLGTTTGRSLDEWLEVLADGGPEGKRERAAWLRSEHGLGSTSAALIAMHSVGEGAERTDEEAYLGAAAGYVEAMFGGRKAHLRPIYEAIVAAGRQLGEDVKVCPCQTIVPLYRRHVFAEIKPSTRTRVDLGLALAGVGQSLSPRLVATGGEAKGDRITHRIPLTSAGQVDAEARRWLAVAYRHDR